MGAITGAAAMGNLGAASSESGASGSGSTLDNSGTGGVCSTLAILSDTEPTDDTVLHVIGSACCNSAPQPAPTNRLGCCQRCLSSASCEVFVWQPSVGTCWLLQWKGSLRRLGLAPDRITGDRPGLPPV